MKSTVISSALLASLTIASPVDVPRGTPAKIDVYTEMDDITAGKSPCKGNAVIFARGTFDSGNVGVWVGPYLHAGLIEEDEDFAFNGVSEQDYPANLIDYAKDNGSENCGKSMAKAVEAYVKKCPTANVFLSGWSQGALCVHKGVKALAKSTAFGNVKGVATFGDEAALMPSVPAFPKDLPVEAYCNQDVAAPDVLCTDSLTSGFKLPTSISEFKDIVIDALVDLLKVAFTSDQRTQAVKLPFTLAYNFFGVTDYFTQDLKTGNLRRWMVLPPHFVYGSNGMAADAAKFFGKEAKKAKAAAASIRSG
ncbi:alpha/beta-hydrolase [Byssothecium circinans]|uniref:cutinase n=1 Tax=Byssothecium circinans TaxID=147558 RepID=A0A6A5TCY0_9PLEO|nr:alpha/beta-hydrolase [Byssothecium circinans]